MCSFPVNPQGEFCIFEGFFWVKFGSCYCCWFGLEATPRVLQLPNGSALGSLLAVDETQMGPVQVSTASAMLFPPQGH